MSERYTEAELALLSDTEREALTATDVDDEGLAEIAGDDDDGEDDADDGTEEDGDADDSESEEAGTEGEQADDDPGEEQEAEQEEVADEVALDLDNIPPVHFVPKLSGDVLPRFQQQIDALEGSKQAERDALEDKFEAGEIDSKAYREQSRAIDSALRTETRKIEAASQNAEINGQLWAAEQAAFFKANKTYTREANPVLWGTLNQEVMRVANDPATSGLTGIQVLCLAKANVEKAFSAMFPGASKDKAPADKPGKKPVTPKPKAQRPTHQTLRDVPAADTADVGNDRFAHLDKLTGLKLEAAIASMSEADKQAYLSGA